MNKHGGYYGKDKDKVLDFSVNINPHGVPEKALIKATESLKNLIRYPEIDGISARKTIADYNDLDKDQIILGNGATELIYLFARTINPEKTMIINPTFNEYEKAFKTSNSSICRFVLSEEDKFKLNLNKLIEKLDEIRPKVLVFCNPNNPTGTWIDTEIIEVILKKMKEINGYLFIDESFLDFTDKKSCKHFIEKYPLFILRSMTKIFAIPGIRLGYGIGSKEIISLLNNYKEPWTLNSIALDIVEELLKDINYVNKTKTWLHNEREFLFNNINDLKYVEAFNSKTNFLLCRLIDGDANELKKKLINYNIYIRTCDDFIGLNNRYFRLAIKSHEDNVELINSLKDLS